MSAVIQPVGAPAPILQVVFDLVVIDVPKEDAIGRLGDCALTVQRGQDADGIDIALGMVGAVVAVRTHADVADALVLEMAESCAEELAARYAKLPAGAKVRVTELRTPDFKVAQMDPALSKA